MKKKFSISENLRNLRQNKQITLEKLANNIGILFDTIRNYEQDNIIPPLKTLIKISSFFGISIDFLLLWNKCLYTRSTRLLYLAIKIDETDQVFRFQIESTANTLLGKKSRELDFNIELDNIALELTEDIHKNIKILREKKDVTQKKLAEYIGVTQYQISQYEKNQTPPAAKLIKLSSFFNVSINFISTGKILFYNFNNKYLQEAILKADNLLSLEDKETLIKLMQRIIEDIGQGNR